MDPKRLSACTFPLRERDLDYAFQVIRDAGFERVDLVGRMPHFSVTDVDFSLGELERLCCKHDIDVANIGSYCGRDFTSPDASARNAAMVEMENTIDAAVRFGARTIRVMPGGGKREEIDELVPYFRESVETAERAGIAMGIENHGTEITGNPEACLEICQKVGSSCFGVLYDPCNLMAAGTDYREALDIFQDYVVHVHLKDGAHDAEGNWSRTMLGEGEIDTRWVIEQCDASGYTGYYALEYEVGSIEPVETGYKKWYDIWMAMS